MDFTYNDATHTYTVDGGIIWPSVSQILSATGFIDTKWFTDYACNRGTLMHRVIAWYLTGELDPDTIDPALLPYYTAWLKFEADTGYKATEIETPRISEIWRFGGTPDSIGILNGKEIVLDIKSGKPQPWTALQTAGYETLIGRRLKRFALELTAEGKYFLTEYKDRNDINIFHASLACVHWQKNHNLNGGR